MKAYLVTLEQFEEKLAGAAANLETARALPPESRKSFIDKAREELEDAQVLYAIARNDIAMRLGELA